MITTEALSPPKLPPLRQELQLKPGPRQVNGAPSWTIFDPLRHLFYQIGEMEFHIFSLWSKGHVDDIYSALTDKGLSAEDAQGAVSEVLQFSLANSLTQAPANPAVETFTAQHAARQKEWWRWLIDHYLFVRIPLVRPARFLERTLPWVAPLWSKPALVLFALMAVVGLFLVSRQWDAFLSPFAYLFTGEGLLAYAVALGFVKAGHELGHAYTATRFGCRVPAMGVSFLVMMPVLYTDTTAAWQLTSRKKRVTIDCAGIGVELMLASASTLAWALLSDGPVRSAVHILATTSWVTTVLINISPFMRFDGYYILSDAIGVPNLQPRSFALGRWRLRELLFDLRQPPPEPVAAPLRRFMIVYAWITWLYRFSLYLGIAFLVYHFFFKILGIILFALEMVVFLGRPIFSELKQWYDMRETILAGRRGKMCLWGLALGAVLTLAPLDRHVTLPAVLTSIEDLPLAVPSGARIEQIAVRNGQVVRKGEVLFTLSDPAIERDEAAAQARVLRLETQLNRAGADVQDLSDRMVLRQELATERNTLQGLARRREQLTMRAGVDGRVVDVPSDLMVGRWVSTGTVLGRVVTPGRYDVQAYASEDELRRIAKDSAARFIPDDAAQASRRAKVVELAGGALDYLDQPMLGSLQGGPIGVVRNDKGQLEPHQSTYRVRLVSERDQVSKSNFVMQQVPGQVEIRTASESVLTATIRSIGRIFAQETSLTD